MKKERIVIAGGSGFIGTALTQDWVQKGRDVVILTRSPQARQDGVVEAAWDGFHLGEWVQHLDGAEAVINLTGKNINCPHTPENVRALIASRVNSVQAIGAAVDHVKSPPRVWVQASAVGFYGDTGDQARDETSAGGDNTLAKICQDWENAFAATSTPRTRRVKLRIGFVLGAGSGALPVLATLTRFFLGGAVGNGRQYISWIHLADLVNMFAAAVENEALSGTFNAVAPQPVTNAAFMRALRRVYHRPWSPPAPAFAVKLGSRLMGSDPSLALTSQRCVPRRFDEAGFSFQFPDLGQALRNLCAKK